MATFTEAFPGGNGAAWPVAWTTSTTSAGGTIDVQSASGRMLTAATTFHACRAILASASWNQADCEVYTFLQLQTGAGQANIALRASGTWSTGDNDSPDTGYKLLVNAAGGDFAFYKRLSGTTTQIGTSQPFTYTVGVIYAVRFRVQGTALKAKIWNSVSGEPGPWTYEQTDSSIIAAGQLQLCYTTTGADARDGRWVGLAVTTDLGATGTLAKTLGNATVVAAGSHNISGTVARTLAAVTTQNIPAGAPILDESGNQIFDEAGNPLYDETARYTSGFVGVGGTVARTLANAVVAASAGSGSAGTLARTLQPAVIQAAGGQGAIGSVARTLGNATVAATGAASGGSGVTGTVARTLEPVETASPLTDEFGSPIVDEFGNPILIFGAEGLHGSGGTVARTLANVIAAAVGGVGGTPGALAVTLANVLTITPLLDENGLPVVDENGNAVLDENPPGGALGSVGLAGTVARTLGNVTSTAAGSQTVFGAIAETLDNATTAAAGSVTIAGTVAKSLDNVTSAAAGTSTPPGSGVAGSINVALANVAPTIAGAHGTSGTLAELLDDAVAAAGGSSVAGAVTATLDALTAAAAGSVTPVTGLLAVTLADLTSTGSGGATITGTADRTLADIIGDAVGSSVAGSVAVTLANVRSTTGGSGSYTDFQSVTLRERGHFVTIREMN